MAKTINRKSALIVVFMVVFIDLMGFGIIIPLSPYLSTRFNASPFEVGALMSIYSLMQFVMSPVWGRVSDRIGRRPILLMGLLGSSLSYFGFAMATTLTGLFVARFVAGVCTANISTAMAAIADVTEKNERSKSMGLIGAAFGLGFVLGPAIGGLLATIGPRFGEAPPFGMSFSALGAGLICLLNFAWAYFVLPETFPIEKRESFDRTKVVSAGAIARLQRLFVAFRAPLVGQLMLVFFLSGLGMAHMEVSLGLFVKDRFGWDLMRASYMFALVGIVMALVQGGLVRRLLPKFGEPKVMVAGLICAAFGMLGLSFASIESLLYPSMIFLALGVSLSNPAVLGSISVLSGDHEQGGTFGETQSLSALGRILGPLSGGFLYQHAGQASPFVTAALMFAIAFGIVLARYKSIPAFKG